jgi:hypothetical protein
VAAIGPSARGARSPYTAWLCGIERAGRILARMCRILNLAEKRSSRTSLRGYHVAHPSTPRPWSSRRPHDLTPNSASVTSSNPPRTVDAK